MKAMGARSLILVLFLFFIYLFIYLLYKNNIIYTTHITILNLQYIIKHYLQYIIKILGILTLFEKYKLV